MLKYSDFKYDLRCLGIRGVTICTLKHAHACQFALARL